MGAGGAKKGKEVWGPAFLFRPGCNHAHHRAQVKCAGEVHIGSVWRLPWQQTQEHPCCLGVDIIAGFGGDQLLMPTPLLTFEVSLMYSLVILARGNQYCWQKHGAPWGRRPGDPHTGV